jgi:hypothetical protein
MTTTRCACQSWFFGSFGPDGSAESFEDYGTDCNQTTTRTFAMGHDAKLVGYMVRADLAGEEIALVDGGMRSTFQNAVHAASSISEALALKAQAQLDAAVARQAKKASREASKTARKSAKAAQAVLPTEAPSGVREAAIKVGRWTYDAEINVATGTATYKAKLGGVKEAVFGEYTEI